MNRLYVIVHPFFDRFSPSKEYRENLYRLFSKPDGGLIVCESGADIERTREQIMSINRGLGIEFVETEYSRSEPSLGWNHLFQQVESTSPSEIIVGGANLSWDEDCGYGECVGYTYHKMKEKFGQTRLDFEICYPHRRPDRYSAIAMPSR